MGRVRELIRETPRELTLSSVTRVGRASDNELNVEHPSVSNFHAVVAWVSPGTWEVRDLGSSNGTYVDGERLEPGARKPVTRNACIGFGDAGVDWELTDDSRPLPEVRDLANGERVIGTPHLLTLSSAEGTIDILEESVGSWVLERAGKIVDIRNGEILDIGGRRFKVGLPLPIAETEETDLDRPKMTAEETLGGASLTFSVSADLESVELRVEWARQRWDSSRAYGRVLLALAQIRLRDQDNAGLANHEQGWIYGDEVCTLADYDGTGRLNVEVHRARADFARRGVPGAPAIVQRRRGTGQIRLGTNRVTILEGAPRSAPSGASL